MDSHLEELKLAVESAAEGMSSEQLSWHPAGKWCAAEALEHLYLTYSGTIKGFSRVIEGGKPLVGASSLKLRLRTFVVVRLGHMPRGRKAPPNAMPRGLPVEKVRNEVGTKIVEMDAIIAQCEERFGRRVRLLDHPILGPLTATEWRRFHLVHGRHHAEQILGLRRGMNEVR
jgi:DinB superfamily